MSGKKENIEQAAIELFARKGPAGTTIKDIASLSGVTEGALYRHYSGKEEMATALFVRELADLRAALVPVIERDLPLAGKLGALIARLYERYDAAPNSLLFILLNFQNLQGIDLPGETGNIYDFITERTAEMLTAAGRPCNELTPTLLAGLIIEPVLFHHYGRLAQTPSTYAGDVCAACCRLLGIAHDHGVPPGAPYEA